VTPEQRAKIQALRKGEAYVPPPEIDHCRQIPKSVQNLKKQINFKKLFEQINIGDIDKKI
jgi:hypothetical protein